MSRLTTLPNHPFYKVGVDIRRNTKFLKQYGKIIHYAKLDIATNITNIF